MELDGADNLPLLFLNVVLKMKGRTWTVSCHLPWPLLRVLTDS